MKEVGIDISGQTSKTIDEKLLMSMDVVITLCGNAEVACAQCDFRSICRIDPWTHRYRMLSRTRP